MMPDYGAGLNDWMDQALPAMNAFHYQDEGVKKK